MDFALSMHFLCSSRFLFAGKLVLQYAAVTRPRGAEATAEDPFDSFTPSRLGRAAEADMMVHSSTANRVIDRMVARDGPSLLYTMCNS